MVVYCLEKDCFKQDQRGLPFCRSANHCLMNQYEAQQLIKRTAVCELIGEAFRLLRLDLTNLLKKGQDQFGRKAGMSMSQHLLQRSGIQKKYELSVMQDGLATFLQKVQKVFQCPFLSKFEQKLTNVKYFRKKVMTDKPLRQQSISTHQLNTFKKQKRMSLSYISPPNLKMMNRPKLKKERLNNPNYNNKKQSRQSVNLSQFRKPLKKNQRVLSASLQSSKMLASNLVQTRIFEIAKESLKSMLLQPQKYINLDEKQKLTIQRKADKKNQVEAFVLAENPPSPQHSNRIITVQKQPNPNNMQQLVRKFSQQTFPPDLKFSAAAINIKQDPQAKKQQLQTILGRINILTQPVRIGTTKLKSLYLDFMVFAVLYKAFFLLRTQLNQPSLSQQNSKIETAMKKILAKVDKDYRRQPLFAAKSFAQIIPCVFPLLKQHWLQINRIAPRHPQKRLQIQQYLLMLGSSVLIIHDNLPDSRRILFNETQFLSLKSSIQKRSYIDKGLQGIQSLLNLMRLN